MALHYEPIGLTLLDFGVVIGAIVGIFVVPAACQTG